MSLLVLLLLVSKADVMDSVVPDAAAAMHIGQVATLDCNLMSVEHAHNGMEFVDCGGLFPKMLASLVVFARDVSGICDLDRYRGKHVLLHGKLGLYKGKLQIILESSRQIVGLR